MNISRSQNKIASVFSNSLFQDLLFESRSSILFNDTSFFIIWEQIGQKMGYVLLCECFMLFELLENIQDHYFSLILFRAARIICL